MLCLSRMRCRNHLAHLLRLSDVRPEMMHTLAAISDFSYGWGRLDAYAPRLQAQVTPPPLPLSTPLVGCDHGMACPLLWASRDGPPPPLPPLPWLQIRKQPATVGKLSSLFDKARSMLELPLMRLSQAKSGHLEKVSLFYSDALLVFARRVLQVEHPQTLHPSGCSSGTLRDVRKILLWGIP